jgi:uncharacterized membrane protein YidH (DUF202 family)
MGLSRSRLSISLEEEPLIHRPIAPDASALDQSSLLSASLANHSIAPMKKIQPNLFLANERTFLNWTNLCLTFAAVGAAAISVRDFAVGYFIIVLGMVLCVRALMRFMARLAGLQNQNKDPHVWEDNYGPIIMSAGIVCAAIIVVLQAFHQISGSSSSS